MPPSALTGTRLRERRLALGLQQAVVAARAGISASYLNLIEHNRRGVTPGLLDRLAGALGSEAAALVPGSDALLAEGLRTAVARAGGGAEGAGVELDRLSEFVSRFPGWAGLVVALDRRGEALERAVEALNDRITHDPHLSQSLHELLSALAAVRSTAAILAETDDLPPDLSARFRQNLHHDSERLATGAGALVAYLDAGAGPTDGAMATPEEEVEAWLSRRGWAVEGAEAAGTLQSAAARALAVDWLARAGADASALPTDRLRGAMATLGADPFALAGVLDCDPLLVMRRLATLPDLTAGLVLCDASGTFTFRKPVLGFPLPRFGAACPLWPLYAALARPFQPVEAVVELPGQGRGRHRALAWAVVRQPMGPRGPDLREAGMLILPLGEGTVPAPVLPVGSSCRVCPRAACPARREPSILAAEL